MQLVKHQIFLQEANGFATRASAGYTECLHAFLHHFDKNAITISHCPNMYLLICRLFNDVAGNSY